MSQYTPRRIEPADRPLVTSLLVRAAGAARLRVATTNDNTRAGFRLTAPRADAVTEARRTKPAIPVTAADGFELMMEISQ